MSEKRSCMIVKERSDSCRTDCNSTLQPPQKTSKYNLVACIYVSFLVNSYNRLAQCSELRTMSVRTLATDCVGPCLGQVQAFFKTHVRVQTKSWRGRRIRNTGLARPTNVKRSQHMNVPSSTEKHSSIMTTASIPNYANLSSPTYVIARQSLSTISIIPLL